MTIQYIDHKSTVFHPDADTDSQEFVLLFGDEVDTTGQEDNNRSEVIYRGRTGWVRTDRLSDDPGLEMYFIDVGQGDSTFIVTPGRRKILIDGGRGDEAFQFLVWKYRLDAPVPVAVDLDLLVVTHADDDHIAGLVNIVSHPLINVREVVHSGIAKYQTGALDTALGDTVGTGQNRMLVTRHDSVADLGGQPLNDTMTAWRTALQNEANLTYRAVDSTSNPININDPDVDLRVLGPRLSTHNGAPAYRWFGSAARTVNGHSVVLRLDYDNLRVMLSGDLNDRSMRFLLEDANFAGEADAHVFKAPHHGSHEYEEDFLEAVHPQVSVVSSGEGPDHGHPRANFLATVGKFSRSNEPLLFSTELVAMFAVDEDAAAPDADNEPDPTDPNMLGQARRRFKKRLNGLINVRSNGDRIYCARRVAAGYQFVTYDQPIRPRDPVPAPN